VRLVFRAGIVPSSPPCRYHDIPDNARRCRNTTGGERWTRAIKEVRATLARARPTAGSFAERRARLDRDVPGLLSDARGTSVEPWHSGTVGGEWVTASAATPTRDSVLLHFSRRRLHRGIGGGLSRPVGAAERRLARGPSSPSIIGSRRSILFPPRWRIASPPIGGSFAISASRPAGSFSPGIRLAGISCSPAW